jgi:hypothetical protein
LGFLAVTLGGLLLGIGSISNWATVGLTSDKAHVLDSPIKGTDIWEGKVTLGLALLVLIAIMAMRVVSSGRARKAIAYLIAVSGVFAVVIGFVDTIRFTERFSGGTKALEAIANSAATTLGVPAQGILSDLLANRAKLISVTRGAGIWFVIAGGVLAVVGGVLSLSWANTGSPEPATTL